VYSRSPRFLIFLWLSFLVIFLGSCKAVSPSSQPVTTPSPGQLPATLAIVPSETPEVIPTETQPSPLAILLAPTGSDPAQAEALHLGLAEAISQAGLRWEVSTGLDLLEPGLRLVIAIPPDPGVADLASAAPQVQFLAVGIPGLEPSANLSLIGGNDRYDQQGFMAGVIAAMITPDWRVGAISLADTAAGKAARNGFMNGAVYFCGLCRAYHGPIFAYPLYVEVPSGASQAEWQAAVDALVGKAVQTVYVFPGAGEPGMWEALAGAGMNIISSGTPPENLRLQWVVSLDGDPIPLILEHLPDLLEGKGFAASMPVVVREVNPALFSPGRQALAEKIKNDLLSGAIDTGVDPQTGENR
jgi:hypothetical protein